MRVAVCLCVTEEFSYGFQGRIVHTTGEMEDMFTASANRDSIGIYAREALTTSVLVLRRTV